MTYLPLKAFSQMVLTKLAQHKVKDFSCRVSSRQIASAAMRQDLPVAVRMEAYPDLVNQFRRAPTFQPSEVFKCLGCIVCLPNRITLSSRSSSPDLLQAVGVCYGLWCALDSGSSPRAIQKQRCEMCALCWVTVMLGTLVEPIGLYLLWREFQF